MALNTGPKSGKSLPTINSKLLFVLISILPLEIASAAT
jgi:hypothetical protein